MEVTRRSWRVLRAGRHRVHSDNVEIEHRRAGVSAHGRYWQKWKQQASRIILRDRSPLSVRSAPFAVRTRTLRQSAPGCQALGWRL
jgi:hypothetical protein